MSETDYSEIVESFEDQHNVEFTPEETDGQTAGNCAGTVFTGCL